MKTTCNQMRDLLERYFDGELSRRQAERVEDHVAGCPRCEARLVTLQRTRGALQGAVRAAAGPVDFEQIWRGIAPRLAGPEPSLWERWNVAIREYFGAYKPVWAMAAAAAVIAALVAVPLLMRDSQGRGAQAPEIAKSNECVIESIESSGSTAMVQELQNQTKVIWMFEEPEEDGSGPSGL